MRGVDPIEALGTVVEDTVVDFDDRMIRNPRSRSKSSPKFSKRFPRTLANELPTA
jgi:hypothetical protein